MKERNCMCIKKAGKPIWIKWAVIAVCLCLVFSAIATLRVFEGDSTTHVIATKMVFEAKVLEVRDDALVVEPLEGTPERDLTERLVIGTEDLAELHTNEYVKNAQAGDTIKVYYLKEDSDISHGMIAVYEIDHVTY